MPHVSILHINEYILCCVILFKSSHRRGWGKCKVIILLIHNSYDHSKFSEDKKMLNFITSGNNIC